MPWTTPETFTAGQTLTAASMNIVSGNARMGNPVYTNEAARDAAITSPEEGMVAYLTAPTVPAATGAETAVPTGITTIYNGSAWVCITPVGARTDDSAVTTSASYGGLAGGGTNPSVTLSTGTTALITLSSTVRTATGGSPGIVSVAVSGATTVAASDNYSLENGSTSNLSLSRSFVLTGLTAGTNTFEIRYRAEPNGTTTTHLRRNIVVVGIA
jgi:hypothetical protein